MATEVEELLSHRDQANELLAQAVTYRNSALVRDPEVDVQAAQAHATLAMVDTLRQGFMLLDSLLTEVTDLLEKVVNPPTPADVPHSDNGTRFDGSGFGL